MTEKKGQNDSNRVVKDTWGLLKAVEEAMHNKYLDPEEELCRVKIAPLAAYNDYTEPR